MFMSLHENKKTKDKQILFKILYGKLMDNFVSGLLGGNILGGGIPQPTVPQTNYITHTR